MKGDTTILATQFSDIGDFDQYCRVWTYISNSYYKNILKKKERLSLMILLKPRLSKTII